MNMKLPWIEQSSAWLRGRKGKARRILLKSLTVTALVTAALALVGPLTYDEQAHLVFDDATRRWAVWGDQLVGLDITAPRQNIFSLTRDLDRVIVIVDHGTIYRSRMLGLANFISRGSIATVADALRWFEVPLTTKQARGIQLCKKLNLVREQEEIVIPSDPYQYGVASWYGPGFHGRLAASGEIYNMYDRTAAHKTLPLQSLVRVVSQRTGNSIIVRINDRGPYVGGRIIDMSVFGTH
jgi:Lytic transglycolase